MKPKKIAIVAEWLTSRGGAEQVLDALLKTYPQAQLFTTVYNADKLPEYKKRNPITSSLQNISIARRRHQSLPPLLLKAIASLDLTGYDLIISSSSAIGKGIRKPKDSVHVCYCHTPMRYVWQSEIDRRLVRIPFGKYFLNYLKKWDLKTNEGVDYFLTNSSNMKDLIKKCYKRDATVIYPPVDITPLDKKYIRESFYLFLARLVPYKKADLAIMACNELGRKLVVAGSGPEIEKLKSLAGKTISFTGRVDNAEKLKLYSRAKALIFPAEEDFGIVPVEAMAQGTPVVAYGHGGATETVSDCTNGVLFDKQDVNSLKSAIVKFENMQFDENKIKKSVEKFSKERFEIEIKDFINKI